ncbi:MAG TPA: CmcI family methyltransferase [Syntrophales bacterium]|nr:CmcI family methyltransferase [Syntrophales bacterium]
MTEKKILSREEFEELRKKSALAMSKDDDLVCKARGVLIDADKYQWIHQTNWFGEPILNLPQDMFALQDIIYRTRPKFIIELGVAWGGSLLFHSTLLTVLGGEKVIGVDIYIPDDLKARLNSHGPLCDKIHLITGSSLEPDTLAQIRSIIGDCREVLVVLDSYHSHDHVFAELRIYSSFIGKGHYLVCGDTIIEHIPIQKHRPRPWGPGNNPKTALEAFLKETERFVVDHDLDRKLLFSCNPGGYLLCTG